MVYLQKIGVACVAITLTLGVGGCGKSSNKAAAKPPASVDTTQPVTTLAPVSSDPATAATDVDAILQQVNVDLAAVDSASADEQDPSQ